jgi:hypothetical protein
MELDREITETREIYPLNITNDATQKENHAADQFFRSLLGFASRQYCRNVSSKTGDNMTTRSFFPFPDRR